MLKIKNHIEIFLVALSLITFSNNLSAYNMGANIVIVNDYVGKRGISLTDGKPALQGEISVSTEQGMYFGIWGSNVDFDDVRAEVDLYAGITKSVTENWAIGTGVFHYANIGDRDQDFQDYFINAIYNKNTMIRYNYSPDFSGIGDSSLFLELQHIHFFTKEILLQTNLSNQNFDEEIILQDFNILKVSIAKSTDRYKLSLTYSNTDSDNFSGRADSAIIGALQINW